MAKQPRARRAKQQIIPGTDGLGDGSRDRVLESAADKYVEARDEFLAARLEMTKRADLLLAKMNEHSIKEYEYEGKVIRVEALEKVKVKLIKGEGEEDE